MIQYVICYYISDKKEQSEMFKTLYDDFNMLGIKTMIYDKKDQDISAADFGTNDLVLADIYYANILLKKLNKFIADYSKYLKIIFIFTDLSKDEKPWMIPFTFEEIKEKKNLEAFNHFASYVDKDNISEFEDLVIDLMNGNDSYSNVIKEQLVAIVGDEYKDAVSEAIDSLSASV